MNNIDFSDVVITNIHYFIAICLNTDRKQPMINRPYTGLIFVTHGRLLYEINGKSYVSDPNHALLLPRGGNYSITCIEKSESLLIDFLTEPPLDNSDIFSFNIGNNAWYLNTFFQLDNLWTFRKPCYKLRCMAGIYEILSKLNETGNISYHPNYKFEYIKPSIDYLEANYTNPNLTNDLLAEKSNISTVYFRKLFAEKYKVSPMKYVLTKRIEKAQDMLKGKYSSIASVAETTGFNSIYHFGRAFKKMTGYTPLEYSRNCINDYITMRLE